MSKNFFFYNKLVGSTILLFYYLNLIFDFSLYSKVYCADSWLSWLNEWAAWLWPVPPSIEIEEEVVQHVIDENTLVIPYVEEGEYQEPPTEAEIAQAFFNRLLDEGTLIYFIFFIVYIFFNCFLFWGAYTFLKENRSQLFSLNFFVVLYLYFVFLHQKLKLLYFIYILVWVLLQIPLYDFNLLETYAVEWYYSMTTVIFCFYSDFIIGTMTINSSSWKKDNKNNEKAFFFFKGRHFEFLSMFCIFVMSLTFCLDFLNLLPEA